MRVVQKRSMTTFRQSLILSLLFAFFFATGVQAAKVCGNTGVWVQVLGAGGPEIDDGAAGPSYLIWYDRRAQVMIDTGPGASVGFDKAGADFADLDAIAFTHLHADHAVDFPSFIKGSFFLDRKAPLAVFGPDSDNPHYPDTETFVRRMIGSEGAFAYLEDFLTDESSGGYRVQARNVPATGKHRWDGFSNAGLRLAAVPVHHAKVPALAWRIEIGGKSVVVTGDFNNSNNVMHEFAKGADALVASHAIAVNAQGYQTELHALPSQLGRVAQQADVRMLILSHRMNRTRGKESQSRAEIAKHYNGPVMFANDGECWDV